MPGRNRAIIPPSIDSTRARAAIGVGEAGGALDTAQQVMAKERLAVALDRVTHRGVPAAAAVKAPAPGDRVVGAHFAAGGGRLIDGRKDADSAPRVGPEVVPLVAAA